MSTEAEKAKRKLERQLRKARKVFVKVPAPAERSAMTLADTPMPTMVHLTKEQVEHARLSGIGVVEYARAILLKERREHKPMPSEPPRE
jgi:hypothetical protein